jgi:hypothetical protein
MRRRKLLVALAGLAVVVAVGVVVLWPPEDRITEANLERIKEGMTQAEVEAILGPPGDYRTGHGETGIPVLVQRQHGDYGLEARSDPRQRQHGDYGLEARSGR